MIAISTYKILVNGSAGANRRNGDQEGLRKLVNDAGIHAEVVATETAEEMDSWLQRIIDESTDRVGISGGDGTVSRAVQRLAHTRTALGILPQGTANNFATSLRLPMDLPSSLRILDEGIVREVDLGAARGRYFIESAGVGLFADILAAYGKGTNKNFMRGIYAMLRVFCAMKPHWLRLKIDGKVHTERAVMCAIANSYRMAEGIAVAPDAKLTDDKLNVVIIGDLKRSELLPYYRAFRAQTQESLPKVCSLTAREVFINGPHSMNVHLDDQVVGTTPVSISSEPRALKVLVDRP